MTNIKDIRNQLTTSNTTQTNSNTMNRYKQDLERRVEENIKYNNSIFEHRDLFEKIEVLDGKVIIRLLKYTGEQDNNGLLLERKFKAFETEGGRPASKIEDWDYSMRAVVIKKPNQDYMNNLSNDELKQRFNSIQVGDIVWLPMSLMHDSNAVFIHERNYPVEGFDGYLSVHIGQLQVKETTPWSEK